MLASLSKGFSNESFWDFTGLWTVGSVLTQSPPFGELNRKSVKPSGLLSWIFMLFRERLAWAAQLGYLCSQPHTVP